MKGTEYRTKEAVLQRGREAIGVPFREMDRNGRLASGKGALGTVVEEGWFGYAPNSESEPDLPEAGVELKVTPYLRGKGGIRAKERLVCNVINYLEEHDKTFYTSAFWRKCNTMLLMSYEHREGVPKGDLCIDEAVLFRFPEEDLAIIEQDWLLIAEKIRSGRAHELSEGDTLYLAACTKGASAASVRPQPFSDIPAKQRAYSLKASYMTRLLNTYVFGDSQSERIVKDPRHLREHSFEELLIGRMRPFYGKTPEQLKIMCGIDSTAKNLNELILARILGVKGKIAQTEEFRRAGIIPKTIRVRRDGSIKENMSFPTFDFLELSRETEWEESALYRYLAPTKFFFVIFREDERGEYVLSQAMLWNIPQRDLEEVRRVWARTVETVRRGVKLEPSPSGVKNDLPKRSESPVAHVRPHGRDGEDKLPLPDGRMMTKQCFWLNNSYIAEQIAKASPKGGGDCPQI